MLSETDMEMIDTRIRAGLSVHTRTILQSAKEHMLNVMEQKTALIREDLKNTAAEIFENMEFLEKFKKHIFTAIDTTITRKMNEVGLSEHMETIARNVTKEVFQGVIRTVVHEVVGSMNKTLNYELKVSKELCYSIDSEIKHVMMGSGNSPTTDELIKKRINETVDKLTDKLMTKQIEEKVV